MSNALELAKRIKQSSGSLRQIAAEYKISLAYLKRLKGALEAYEYNQYDLRECQEFAVDGFYELYRTPPHIQTMIVKFCNQNKLFITRASVTYLRESWFNTGKMQAPPKHRKREDKINNGIGKVVVDSLEYKYLIDSIPDKAEFERLFK